MTDPRRLALVHEQVGQQGVVDEHYNQWNSSSNEWSDVKDALKAREGELAQARAEEKKLDNDVLANETYVNRSQDVVNAENVKLRAKKEQADAEKAQRDE